MEIKEIFENLIKIEPKVMSIESLFNNPERVEKTNYKPSYQRNYVWDDEKATYFIESILLGTEIPPLVYFRNSDKVEVIDGRQRYQTILRFINNEFKLKKNGLHKLEDIGIANKSFKDIGETLEDLFWDTKLRIIEFSFHSKTLIDDEIEELVKKEIFKRYNSGITPLKPTEIDRAAYFEDDLNTYIKLKLQNDSILYRDISSILHFEKTNTEIILKKIRQLIVQHQIPIKYYSVKKDTIISKYYEFLFSNINESEISSLFNSFIEKINLLKKIKRAFDKRGTLYNRLISECLFWAFSILETENHSLQLITNSVIESIVTYISNEIKAFEMDRSSFSKELHNRYLITSIFFSENFGIDFQIYLQNNQEFKQKTKEITPKNTERTSFDELRINKPEPSSIAIMDICRQMERQRFLIRPPYQRNEVINKKKSSSIIESILLGIKLPPIFVFKRKDEISEVLDGQQRLLSILGFIKKPYLDENKKLQHSDKDGYSLNLKNGILKNLNGKKFDQLDKDEKDKIKNFDLWIIEINQKNNLNFEPIDLFIRLNNKPYPIKEDTFEMWNSYISRDIIETIKSIYKNNKDWFYLRKNNSRMENENIYTSLAYLQYSLINIHSNKNPTSKDLDIYKVVNKINFRVKSKNEITKVLEDIDLKEKFIQACNDLEFTFISKIKELVSEDDDYSTTTLNKNLDYIFNIDNGRRTQQSFYALWYFTFEIPFEIIKSHKYEIRKCLNLLFSDMTDVESKLLFDSKVNDFREKFKPYTLNQNSIQYKRVTTANLGDITFSFQGVNINNPLKVHLNPKYEIKPYFKKVNFENFKLKESEITSIDVSDRPGLKDFFTAKPKILLKKSGHLANRFVVSYFGEKALFNNDIYCFVSSRFGFNPKFILSILFSRYLYFIYNKNRKDSEKQISLSELRGMPIPLIPLSEQKPFITIINYLLFLEEVNERTLFFERLLDAMVYELFLPEEINNSGCNVLIHLDDLMEITEDNNEQNAEIINKIYLKLSNPNHFIAAALLKLLNVNEVKLIEKN
jgi:hypothetical protein